MLNLEPLASDSARSMVTGVPKKAEILITKASAVLAEQGIYAFGLFLAHPKNEAGLTNGIDLAIRKLLADADLFKMPNNVSKTDYYANIGKPLNDESEIDALYRILLTKQLMEIALNYGRYHAKAQGAG